MIANIEIINNRITYVFTISSQTYNSNRIPIKIADYIKDIYPS